MKLPAVFFDRDGIIVQPVNGEAPTNAKDLQLIPEIIPEIKRIKKLGFLIFVVSNQPDIAIGLIDEKTKKELEKKFRKLLKEKDIFFDGIYYCHHNLTGINSKYVKNCSCQKPKPGMLLKASRKFNINLNKSYMIGDRATDIMPGSKVRATTILYDPLSLQKKYLTLHQIKPSYKISNLKNLNKIIK